MENNYTNGEIVNENLKFRDYIITYIVYMSLNFYIKLRNVSAESRRRRKILGVFIYGQMYERETG